MNEVVDTNVILRFLVGDDVVQQKKAETWFKEAELGKRTLIISPLVIAECCFVLESFYKKERNEIISVFETFLAQKWLEVENQTVLVTMWDNYKKGLHFVDSYLIAWSKQNNATVLTFDKQLIKLSQ